MNSQRSIKQYSKLQKVVTELLTMVYGIFIFAEVDHINFQFNRRLLDINRWCILDSIRILVTRVLNDWFEHTLNSMSMFRSNQIVQQQCRQSFPIDFMTSITEYIHREFDLIWCICVSDVPIEDNTQY